MKHTSPISQLRPAPASSLLVLQQKAVIFATFAAALLTFGEAIGVFLSLRNP